GPPQLLFTHRSKDMVGTSARGDVLAIPAYQRVIVVHRPDRQTELKPCEDARICAISPDGRWIAHSNHHCRTPFGAVVSESETGKPKKAFPVREEGGVAFSPDGLWLLTTGGGYRLWRTQTWEPGPTIAQQPGESGAVPGYQFTRDGKTLALSAGF